MFVRASLRYLVNKLNKIDLLVILNGSLEELIFIKAFSIITFISFLETFFRVLSGQQSQFKLKSSLVSS